jgi:hypothetical protein
MNHPPTFHIEMDPANDGNHSSEEELEEIYKFDNTSSMLLAPTASAPPEPAPSSR